MKRILNAAMLTIAALVFSNLAARHAAAIELTLSLDTPQSVIGVGGSFGGIPFVPQDTAPVQPGITDLDPTKTSLSTTFSGTITVNVNNVNNPTSIQILSSVADANSGGLWLPKQFPAQDIGGNGVGDPGPNGTCCEFGLPPDGDSDPAAAAPPGPAEAGDWGLRNRHPAFGVTLALATARDIVFNVTSPVEPVAAGSFSSLNENIEFAAGWLDYWVAPAAGGLQGRAELAGGDDDNAADTAPSTYIMTMLPGNQRKITLTIPINVDGDPGDDAIFNYTGTLVATLVVPEPTTFALSGMAMAFVAALSARRRK